MKKVIAISLSLLGVALLAGCNRQAINQTQSPTPLVESTNESADWQTYKNDKYGFEFKYPTKIQLIENGDQIILNHKIPYENHGSCDMTGDQTTYPMLDDFKVSIKMFDSPLVATIKKISPYIPEENFIDGNLKANPGFINEYKKGSLNGFSIYDGIEGCGQMVYYFPITDSQTLVITDQLVQILSGVVPPSSSNEVLKVPGVITQEEHRKIFEQILTDFKFTKE